MVINAIRRKYGKYCLILCVTVGLGMLIIRIGQSVFAIQTIEVIGENIEVIVNQKRISKNLLFFPSETIRQQILLENPWLSDVQFKKKFPHILQIAPALRVPFAQLQSGSRVVLLDNHGMVLAYSDEKLHVPHFVIMIPEFHIGQILDDKRIILALSLVLQLKDILSVQTITDYDGTYLLVKSEQLNIFIPQEKPVNESIATLQTLLAGFRIKGRLPTVVDLRFDKPIVTF